MKLPRLKFCGFTREQDVLEAIGLQVDAIGLNFYPRSKRYVSPGVAKRLSMVARGHCSRVGIFVDASPEQIQDVVSECPLDAIQLHGDETIEWLTEYENSRHWTGLPILKALAYRGSIDDGLWGQWVSKSMQANCSVIGLLVDAYDPVEKGGTGKRVNWGLLSPRPASFVGVGGRDAQFLLAGGLDSNNIYEALRMVEPYGIDVASGIEDSPGVKDPAKMRAIVTAVRDHYASR